MQSPIQRVQGKSNMNKRTAFTLVTTGFLLSGCTSITVTPLDASYAVKKICVRENPKVTIPEFVTVIEDSLQRHKIESQFVESNVDKYKLLQLDDDQESDQKYMNITPTPADCEFSLTYTGRRSWDLGTYLSTADIAISNKSGVIAKANYHLVNKGGFSLFKWQGVKTKLEPVMDELLQQYKK